MSSWKDLIDAAEVEMKAERLLLSCWGFPECDDEFYAIDMAQAREIARSRVSQNVPAPRRPKKRRHVSKNARRHYANEMKTLVARREEEVQHIALRAVSHNSSYRFMRAKLREPSFVDLLFPVEEA